MRQTLGETFAKTSAGVSACAGATTPNDAAASSHHAGVRRRPGRAWEDGKPLIGP